MSGPTIRTSLLILALGLFCVAWSLSACSVGAASPVEAQTAATTATPPASPPATPPATPVASAVAPAQTPAPQQPVNLQPAAALQAAATPTRIELSGLLATPTTEPAPPAPPTPPAEPRPDGVQRTVKAPILMYHYISTPPADADIYRVDLSTPPDLFAAHLDRLLAEGYTTISLYQLLAHLVQGTALPDKPVVITFDDGYRDNYENAFPLLRQRDMTATFFVVTDFIDEERPLYLSWDMAREMLAGGMSIESHSRNHASLAGQDDDYLVWQALGSLETLQYELGARPRFVSYPAGDYDQRTIDIFQSADYWAGVTTSQGAQQASDRLFELERIRVRNTTTPDDLIRYLEADW